MTTPKNELLFLALGGSNEIGMNVNLYGCDGKWVMVDLGLTFANSEYPGIDLVLPDLEFIEKRKKDLLGIVLTHGHEDHIGAVAYFAADLNYVLFMRRFPEPRPAPEQMPYFCGAVVVNAGTVAGILDLNGKDETIDGLAGGDQRLGQPGPGTGMQIK